MALKSKYFDMTATSPVIYEIDADMVQIIVSANTGHRLTETEIERLHYAMLENHDVYLKLVSFVLAAADAARNNSENQWESVDLNYAERKPLRMLGDYYVGD